MDTIVAIVVVAVVTNVVVVTFAGPFDAVFDVVIFTHAGFLVFYCAVVNVTYADDVEVTFVDVVVVALMLLFKCS